MGRPITIQGCNIQGGTTDRQCQAVIELAQAVRKSAEALIAMSESKAVHIEGDQHFHEIDFDEEDEE